MSQTSMTLKFPCGAKSSPSESITTVRCKIGDWVWTHRDRELLTPNQSLFILSNGRRRSGSGHACLTLTSGWAPKGLRWFHVSLEDQEIEMFCTFFAAAQLSVQI